METELLPGITMRQATPDDTAIFAEIHEEAAHWLWSHGIHQWRPGTFQSEWIRGPFERGEAYLASEQGTVITTVIIQPTDTETWGKTADAAGYIHGLRVRRSVAGRGIGLAVRRRAEREIAARGNRVARLDCMGLNPALCSYYERAGYRCVRSIAFEDQQSPYVLAIFEKALDEEAGCIDGRRQ
jgi:ribosomal protein S18 acetylase RimI-like enzyme